MKTILYATDYSKNSELALKYAFNMSVKTGAKLMVIHVFEYPTLLDGKGIKPEPAFPDLEGDALREHRLKLQTFCTRILKNDAVIQNIEITAIQNKSVLHGIIEKASAVDVSLIVVGMKGASKIRELIMGSTTKHLIENAPCPVLSVPGDSVKKDIDTMVYATDFEDKDLGAINRLTKIAEPFNAKIKIVHVLPLEGAVREKQLKDLQDTFHKYINYPNLELDVLYSDDTFNALKIYYRNANADLMAMLHRKRSGITSKVFHRDLVKRMETYGKIPLLSFNADNYGIFHV